VKTPTHVRHLVGKRALRIKPVRIGRSSDNEDWSFMGGQGIVISKVTAHHVYVLRDNGQESALDYRYLDGEWVEWDGTMPDPTKPLKSETPSTEKAEVVPST
jgi:hypothetical protein